jgi:phenylacetate-coenzyme A ligase PaaK-like adenylate-forming protein
MTQLPPIVGAAEQGLCPDWPVYGLAQEVKRQRMEQALSRLTLHHAERCESYRKILSARAIDATRQFTLSELPFLPVRLFKECELRSVEKENVVKTLTSSGTTSAKVSRIYLDRETATAQTRALVFILQALIGKARLPMLIIDHPGVIKNRHEFSARGAGILGLSTFGRDHTYALAGEQMQLDMDAVRQFLCRHAGEPILLFGFTFMVWKYLIQALQQRGERLDLANAILIHSGGWKKMQDEAVDVATFKSAVKDTTGIARVHNFYGMVEQVGSIFVECEHGYLHAPAFADVLVRDPSDWSICAHGTSGLIQVVSLLPHSYPGHSLLTEDLGAIVGEDDCRCGRSGKYFQVSGRIVSAELRGCSDTHGAVA